MTRTEKLICSDPELALADRKMTNAYRKILGQSSAEQADELRRAQLSWLKLYSATCDSIGGDAARKACILRFLGARTKQLEPKVR